MDNSHTLRPAQLIAIILCARCFATMTSYPSAFTNAPAYMIGIAWSGAIQLLLLLPAAVLLRRTGARGPCELAFSSGPARGAAVTLLYLTFFLYEVFIDLGSFTYFMDYYFTGSVPRVLTVLAFLTASVCLARLSEGVIGRCAQFILGGLVLLLLGLLLGSLHRLDPLNFYFQAKDGTSQVFTAVYTDHARCECLVILTFLMGRLTIQSDGTRLKTCTAFVLSKTLLLELVFALITAVIGDRALVTKQPFFALSAYSGSALVERMDAPFLFVWVTTGILKLANLLHCCGICVRLLFPKATPFRAAALPGIFASVAAAFILVRRRWEILAYTDHGFWAVILLTFIIPLILLIKDLRRKHHVKLSSPAPVPSEA